MPLGPARSHCAILATNTGSEVRQPRASHPSPETRPGKPAPVPWPPAVEEEQATRQSVPPAAGELTGSDDAASSGGGRLAALAQVRRELAEARAQADAHAHGNHATIMRACKQTSGQAFGWQHALGQCGSAQLRQQILSEQYAMIASMGRTRRATHACTTCTK